MKAPAFQLYAAEQLANPALAMMTPEQRGGFFMLMLYAWVSSRPGRLPNDEIALAKLSGLGSEWPRCAAAILRAFVETPTTVSLPWMVDYFKELEAFKKERSASGRKGAESKKLRSGSAKAQLVAELKLSTSSSSASSSSSSSTERRRDPDQSPLPARDASDSAPGGAGDGRSGRAAGAAGAELERLLEGYRRAWVARFSPADGQAPTVEAADRVPLQKLLKTHGTDAVSTFVDRFISDPDPFLAKNGHRLRHIGSRLDAYRANGTARPGFAAPMAPAALGGKVAI